MFRFGKRTSATETGQATPTKSPQQRPLVGVLRTGSSSSPSVSSGSSGSTERRVRFSEPEVLEEAAERAAALQSPSRQPGSSGGPRRPPRSPPTPPAAPSSAADMEGGPSEHSGRPPREQRGRSEGHHRRSSRAASDAGEGGPPQHRQRGAPSLPQPEEVAAAAGAEGDVQPGSLAECAQLFHKYKDPRKGAIGVDGFGRLLGDAGRLDSLRSPIARAAGVKREMTTADTNGDGWVDWAEFSAWFPTFQQQHYTQQRNQFYEEKGKEAEEAAAAAAEAEAAAKKAAEEAAAAEAAARRQRAAAARAAARKAWEDAQAAAALRAAADAAVAAAGPPDTPRSNASGAGASSQETAAETAAEAAAQPDAQPGSAPQPPPAAPAAPPPPPQPLSLEGLDDEQLAAELRRLELAAAAAQQQLADARARLAGRGGGAPADGGSEQPPSPSAAPDAADAAVAAAAAPAPDSGRSQRQRQRQALVLEAAAAAAAADTAAAAAAAAEAAAAAAEAEEAAASADAAAAAAAASDPDLQRVFAAFAAFGKNSALQGTAAAPPHLDNQQWSKLCRDARLLGGGLTLAAADVVFARVAGKGGSRMSWRQFAAAVPLLARKRGWPPADIVARVAACPGPQLNSEAGSTGRQGSFTGRSGSLPSSYPVSGSGGSRPPSVAAASEDGAAASDDERGSRPGSTVGGFTPLRRPSLGGSAGASPAGSARGGT